MDKYIPSQEALDYSVYWIHLPEHTDIKIQGYVGITNNVKERFARHKSTAANPDKQRSVHLENAINKYGDSLVYEVLIEECDPELAQFIELELRPAECIGWNIAIGGGLPPKCYGSANAFYGKTHSEESIKKMKEALANHDRAGLSNANADQTIYTFKHAKYGVRMCTRYEFEKEFGFTLKPLFRKNNQTKTRKGWEILHG